MTGMQRISGRQAAWGCCVGLCALVLNCPGARAKGGPGLPGRPRNELPGVSYLLPHGIRKEAAGILARGGVGRGAVLGGGKGTISVAAGINAFALPAVAPGAGVASDGSLGKGKVSYSGGTYGIPASVGKQVGGNLFESFSQFSLFANEVADFQGPGDVRAIIARVTGGSVSSIDGTIESDIQGANLFLINPAGVMFGPHASLYMSGAFTVSTANYVKLADGGKFNASLGSADMLTGAAVNAFGFTGAAPAPVSFNGSQMLVAEGAGINVIAGNVTLNSTEFGAPSGEVTIFSAASAGVMPFSLAAPGEGYDAANFSALGTLKIINGSYLHIDGAGGGRVVLRAGAITVDNSEISSADYGSAAGGDVIVSAAGSLDIDNTGQIGASSNGAGNAGDVTVTVTGAVNLEGGGQILTGAYSSGKGGNVIIRAGSLNIDGSAAPDLFTGIGAQTNAGATGDAGDVDVVASGAVDMEGGGEIATDTYSSGKGGNVIIHAGSLDIDGSATPSLSPLIGDNSYGAGNAGDVAVTVTGAVMIKGGGEISADANAAGDGGNVTIHAGSLNIDGSAAPDLFTGIGAETDSGATGNAGKVNVTASGGVDIEAGGEIATDTYSSGNGGNVTIDAGSLNIDGSATPVLFTGIGAQTNEGATGDAGAVDVTVSGAVEIRAGGNIFADTFSSGAGGSVNIHAGSLNIDGSATPDLFTGIGAETNAGATGNAGAVAVTVTGPVDIEGGGEIATDTYSSGNGGNVAIHAGALNINGSATPDLFTGIGAQTNAGATGDAGDVDVAVSGAVDMEGGGQIFAGTSSSGAGGSVSIRADTLTMAGLPELASVIGAQTNAGATGNAGNVTVTVSQAADIAGGGEIFAGTYSAGNGGNVTVGAGSLNIDGLAAPALFTGIGAQTNAGATGDAGEVDVAVPGAVDITNGGEIFAGTSSSGAGGNVTVDSGSLNIDGSASPGPFTGLDAESLADATGDAGNVNVIVTGAAGVEGGGEISSSAYGAGSGGSVKMSARDITLSGAGKISAASFSNISGRPAGDVTVRCENLSVDSDGAISAASVAGNAGSIVIRARSNITLAGNGRITSSAGQSGGNISVTVNHLLYLDQSSVTATAGRGPGGNIVIDPEFVVLYDSLISANDATGGEGNVQINATYLFETGSRIFATGVVESPAPSADLVGALVGLPASPVDAGTQLQETCAMAIQGDFSSFLEVGQGDIEAGPDEAQGHAGQDGKERPGDRKPAGKGGAAF